VTVFNTDNAADVAALMRLRPRKAPEVIKRPLTLAYGSDAALDWGLDPVEADSPDILLPKDSWVDAVQEAHDLQIMPVYHMHDTWRPHGTRYNQDGLGYCWTWSGTGCLMTCRAMEDKDTVLLAPVSMGYLVGWANRGNYLASFVKGAMQDGICPVPAGETFNSTNRSASFWGQYANERKLYRLAKTWDTDPRNMLQHVVSILCYGRSLFVAYAWWGHAVEIVFVRYNKETRQWEVGISNSHNEPEPIILTGSQSIPNEAIAFVSSYLAV
jgi:hypothetical protein